MGKRDRPVAQGPKVVCPAAGRVRHHGHRLALKHAHAHPWAPPQQLSLHQASAVRQAGLIPQLSMSQHGQEASMHTSIWLHWAWHWTGRTCAGPLQLCQGHGACIATHISCWLSCHRARDCRCLMASCTACLSAPGSTQIAASCSLCMHAGQSARKPCKGSASQQWISPGLQCLPRSQEALAHPQSTGHPVVPPESASSRPLRHQPFGHICAHSPRAQGHFLAILDAMS